MTVRYAARSFESEHRFQKCVGGCLGGLGRDRIVAKVWTMRHARVLIGELLVGVGVYEESVGLLPDFAVARASNVGDTAAGCAPSGLSNACDALGYSVNSTSRPAARNRSTYA